MDGMNGFTSVNALPAAAPPPTNSVPQPAPAAGTKRKRDSSVKFYAVRIGKAPGIYHSWPECLDQVRGFPKAVFKSFTTLTDAQAFVNNEGDGGNKGGVTKYYGVQSGRKPGVYTSWPEVLEQITGWRGPKHKAFKTRVEAEMFVAEAQQQGHSLVGMGAMNGDVALESVEGAGETPTKKLKVGKAGKAGGKALKDENASPAPAVLETGEYEPGEGPLPEGAEDNFDPTITLDQTSGTARYKTATELSRTKLQAIAPLKDSPIKIYTDGSALSNGQAAANGGIGVYFGPLDKRNVSEPLTGSKQTNQRAELTAILRALEVAPRDRKIVIITDSNYAIRCVTEWFRNWRRNGWQNSARKPVENRDLVQKVIEVLEERFRLNRHRSQGDELLPEVDVDDVNGGKDIYTHRQHWERGPASVKFVWVKGHAKDEGNIAADGLAVNGARAGRELGEDIDLSQ